MEGDRIGDYVKKGGEPKVFRIARGRFQLIEDPLDDTETRRARKELAIKRAEELKAMVLTRELTIERKRGPRTYTPNFLLHCCRKTPTRNLRLRKEKMTCTLQCQSIFPRKHVSEWTI